MALVARVFSLKIRCSRSMNLSTSHIAMSERKSWGKDKLNYCSRFLDDKDRKSFVLDQFDIFAHTKKSNRGISILYLSFSRALQYMHQCTGHFLFALDTQHGLQHSTQGAVVIGDILCKLLVQLHRQDVHGLEARFEA